MFDLGLGELLRDLLVALGAELAAGLEQQLLIVRLVRVVAGDTFAVFDRLVFDLSLGELLRNLLVAFVAQLCAGFNQQLLVIGAMRVVAGDALAVFDRLMPALGGFRERIMALAAQGWRELGQQVGVECLVRIMAGDAFAVLDGLMLNFARDESILVAVKAVRCAFAGHSLRRLGLVAIRALPLRVRGMNVGLQQPGRSGRLAGGIGPLGAGDKAGLGIVGGRARHRHTIKEKSQPLLFSGAGTAGEHEQACEQPEQATPEDQGPARGGA